MGVATTSSLVGICVGLISPALPTSLESKYQDDGVRLSGRVLDSLRETLCSLIPQLHRYIPDF